MSKDVLKVVLIGAASAFLGQWLYAKYGAKLG